MSGGGQHKRGRGRLSSIDLLPAEADDVVAWAFQELRERERTQLEIWFEFNDKLAELGLGPISKTAFNRHSIRIATIARRHEEVRRTTAAVMDRMEPGQTDDLTIYAAETIKTMVVEIMENEKQTPKGAMELARALQAAVNSQKLSLDRKRAIQEQFAAKVDDALDAVKSEKGLDDEQADFFRRKVLGLKS